MDFAEAIVKAKIQIKEAESDERNKNYYEARSRISSAIYYLKNSLKSVEEKDDAKRTTAA
jgi:acyl-CoA reductase-like NAD-dependent aldehyde dehydrogenase